VSCNVPWQERAVIGFTATRNAQTAGHYALAFLVAICMGLARHLLPPLRQQLKSRCARRTPPATTVANPLNGGDATPHAAAAWRAGRSDQRLLRAGSPTPRAQLLLAVGDTLLYAATVTLGFLNMLVVMTYNPGLLMAVVLGETAGHVCTLYCAVRPPRGASGDAPVDAAAVEGATATDPETGASACH